MICLILSQQIGAREKKSIWLGGETIRGIFLNKSVTMNGFPDFWIGFEFPSIINWISVIWWCVFLLSLSKIINSNIVNRETWSNNAFCQLLLMNSFINHFSSADKNKSANISDNALGSIDRHLHSSICPLEKSFPRYIKSIEFYRIKTIDMLVSMTTNCQSYFWLFSYLEKIRTYLCHSITTRKYVDIVHLFFIFSYLIIFLLIRVLLDEFDMQRHVNEGGEREKEFSRLNYKDRIRMNASSGDRFSSSFDRFEKWVNDIGLFFFYLLLLQISWLLIDYDWNVHKHQPWIENFSLENNCKKERNKIIVSFSVFSSYLHV